jgi:hypothetical protein
MDFAFLDGSTRGAHKSPVPRRALQFKAFKCAWFDEKDYFEFFPLQAIKAKTVRAPA